MTRSVVKMSDLICFVCMCVPFAASFSYISSSFETFFFNIFFFFLYFFEIVMRREREREMVTTVYRYTTYDRKSRQLSFSTPFVFRLSLNLKN